MLILIDKNKVAINMDMGKSNTMVNGIKLQDGRVIQGYLKQDAVIE